MEMETPSTQAGVDDKMHLDQVIEMIYDALADGAVDDKGMVENTQHLTYFLAHNDPGIAQRAFDYFAEIHETLGEQMLPAILDWLFTLASSKKALSPPYVKAMATLASYDIESLQHCFSVLDSEHPNALDDVYASVLLDISSTLLLEALTPSNFVAFMQIILAHMDRPAMTDKLALIVLQVSERQAQQFDAWWHGCDSETRDYLKQLMPTSRAIQMRWARHQTSFHKSGSSLASSQSSRKRTLQQIGRLDLNGSALSEIAPLDESIKNIPSPKARAKNIIFEAQPDEELPPREEFVEQIPLDPPESTPESFLEYVNPHTTALLYLLTICSVLFAVYGLTSGALLISQDYGAWQQRMILNKYRISVERSLAEVQRVANVVHEWTLALEDAMPTEESSQIDRERAMTISALWEAIDKDLKMPKV